MTLVFVRVLVQSAKQSIVSSVILSNTKGNVILFISSISRISLSLSNI